MKVVDTLEKYQQRVVNTKSESGKEFVLFKRQLYQMYEVQNRSIDEHDTFSTKLERQNLRWLYRANLDYIGEMQKVSWLDTMVAHGSLKGSVFRMKALSAQRVNGLAAWAFAGATYFNMAQISLMLGPALPTAGIVFSFMYGARAFAMKNTISRIDYVEEGEHTGKLRMKVYKSPFKSSNIIINPKFTMSICALGGDDMGEEDADGNVLYCKEYLDEDTGIPARNGFFTVPADAHRDKITMEWIFAQKNDESETDALFNEVIVSRHMRIAKTGGLTGLRKLTAESTGYANFGDEEEINEHLKNQPDAADQALQQMSETYGQEHLEKMKPTEFYRLYKDFSLGKMQQ